MNDCINNTIPKDIFHSSVIYAPCELIGGDPLWATISLFHERVLIPRTHHFDEWAELTDGKFQPSKEALNFNNSIDALECENVIEIIDADRYFAMVEGRKRDWDKIEHEMVKIFETGNADWENDITAALITFSVIEDNTMARTLATTLDIPIVAGGIKSSRTAEAALLYDSLPEFVAHRSICRFGVPYILTVQPDDILEARKSLNDELLAFRAAIVKLAWFLHEAIRTHTTGDQLKQEVDFLVNTRIKGAIMDLENRIKKHKNKRIRRLLQGIARILVEAAGIGLTNSLPNKILSGSKSLLQLADEFDKWSPPENDVAGFLYGFKRILQQRIHAD